MNWSIYMTCEFGDIGEDIEAWPIDVSSVLFCNVVSASIDGAGDNGGEVDGEVIGEDTGEDTGE